MHLFLKDVGNENRTLILASYERADCPARALVFRANDGKDTPQALVEFIPTKEIDLGNAVMLTTRKIKGCLGLISIGDGGYSFI